MGRRLYNTTRQQGLSPPLRPYSHLGRDASPLGLAIVEGDKDLLAAVGPTEARGLPKPKAVADTEESEGEAGKVCLGTRTYSRVHGSEHT